MYWMLLPPNANTGRHLESYSLPLCGNWANLLRTGWGAVVSLLASHRR